MCVRVFVCVCACVCVCAYKYVQCHNKTQLTVLVSDYELVNKEWTFLRSVKVCTQLIMKRDVISGVHSCAILEYLCIAVYANHVRLRRSVISLVCRMSV